MYGAKRASYLIHLAALLRVCIIALLTSTSALAQDDIDSNTSSKIQAHEVNIVATFLNMHTGPGRGYPVFHVVEKGETVELLKQRTSWIKVKTQDKYQPRIGWIKAKSLNGSTFTDNRYSGTQAGFTNDVTGETARWRLSGAVGDLGGADSFAFTAGVNLSENLVANLRVGQAIGEFSNNVSGYVSVQSHPFPDWLVKPYFGFGAGEIKISPNTRLVQLEDETNSALLLTGGTQVAISQRFLFYIEYNQHRILTERDINQDINEWLTGFTVRF